MIDIRKKKFLPWQHFFISLSYIYIYIFTSAQGLSSSQGGQNMTGPVKPQFTTKKYEEKSSYRVAKGRRTREVFRRRAEPRSFEEEQEEVEVYRE